ncbi:MAG TPA: hypothetical protein QGG18_05015 [Rhodospirillales bacterium]|jgi:hypothetical protein|nr:hypothetical protein [Rhodospirillales bacterium]|tara:strand:- start:999 stop:1151 length:153 start_codon:yes stop_codon:yes gene_type:complete
MTAWMDWSAGPFQARPEGWRHVEVTKRRTAIDYARRIAKRFEWHYTPRHV